MFSKQAAVKYVNIFYCIVTISSLCIVILKHVILYSPVSRAANPAPEKNMSNRVHLNLVSISRDSQWRASLP